MDGVGKKMSSASFKNKMRMRALKDQEHEENEKLKQDVHIPEPDKNDRDYQEQKYDWDNKRWVSRYAPFQIEHDNNWHSTPTGRINEPKPYYQEVEPKDEAWANQPDREIKPTNSTVGAQFNTPNGDKNNVIDAWHNQQANDPEKVITHATTSKLSGDLEDLHNTKSYKTGNPAYKRIANKETTDNHLKQVVDTENKVKGNIRQQLETNKNDKFNFLTHTYPKVYPEEYNKEIDKMLDEHQKMRDKILYDDDDDENEE